MANIETTADHEAYVSTIGHKEAVAELMNEIARVIRQRGKDHDDSKLEDPEFKYFSKYTPLLSKMTYGSEEYNKCLAELKPALEHHYANSRHHPEHFKDGIKDMNLVDIIEMFVDWYCASKRQMNGNIRKSIEHNQSRFGISDDLASILINSIELLDK